MSHDVEFQLRDVLPYRLNRAAEATSAGFQSYYRPQYGLLRTESRVLFHLGRYDVMTARDICARATLHKTKVSRAVAALKAKRLVTSQPAEHDRRHEPLILTRLGRAAFDDLVLQAERYNAELMQTWTGDERRIIMALLERLAPTGR